MRPPRWKPLVEKSIAACCAAIEIYNKPVVSHRHEAFAILVVSSWELLLKARLLKEAGNRMQAIYDMVPVARKDGTPGRRLAAKKNRAGNPATISLGAAIHRVGQLSVKALDAACRENLLLLTEIRDNAIHFVNDDRDVAMRVHEIGTASLVNYVAAIVDWFDQDLGSHRFAILPLSFEPAASAKSVKPPRRSQQAANLLVHMERTCAEKVSSAGSRFAVSLRVEATIVGSRAVDAVPIKLATGPDAVKVELTEEEFRKRWPHDYAALLKLLGRRLPGFTQDKQFHDAKRLRSSDERYARDRRLDMNNVKSSIKKTYYSDAMVDALFCDLRPSTGVSSTPPDAGASVTP